MSDRFLKRQVILSRAVVAIHKSKRYGGLIAADVVAKRLLEEEPRCSMSLNELRDEIARLAVDRGVDVEFADRSNDQEKAPGSRRREIVAG